MFLRVVAARAQASSSEEAGSSDRQGAVAMDQLELLLRQFLVPDNEARKQAEEQIRRLSKDPQLVPALLHHVRSSPSPEVRQLAAVLLRKKITGHWMNLSAEVRGSVKMTLLESITLEQW